MAIQPQGLRFHPLSNQVIIYRNVKRYTPFLVIWLLYLVIGTLFAIYTPPWQAPDEPAHYNYVRQLADGRWPAIEPGDYDQDLLSYLPKSGSNNGKFQASLERQQVSDQGVQLLPGQFLAKVGGHLVGEARYHVSVGLEDG